MALPGDISPSPASDHSPRPAPDYSPQPEPGGPGNPSEPGNPGEPDNSDRGRGDGHHDGASEPGEKAGSLPGLPRLFFGGESDRQEQSDHATTSHGQPGGHGLRAFGQPGEFGPPPGAGQPPQFGRQGQQTPARAASQRPTRPPDRELRQRAIASLVLGGLSLVALLGLGGDLHRGVYLLIFSAAIGIAACVIGITAVVKARKTGSYRPRGAVGGIVLGTIAALLSITILGTYLAFPRQVDNYIKCLSQSQSSGRQQTCIDKFYKSIRLGAPGPGTGGAVRISAASGQRRGPA